MKELQETVGNHFPLNEPEPASDNGRPILAFIVAMSLLGRADRSLRTGGVPQPLAAGLAGLRHSTTKEKGRKTFFMTL